MSSPIQYTPGARGLLVRVHLHYAVLCLHAGDLQAQAVQQRNTTRSHQHEIDVRHDLPIGEGTFIFGVGLLRDALDGRVGHLGDAAAFHFGHEQINHEGVVPAERSVVAAGEERLRAQDVQNARQLHGDVATADYERALGERLQFPECVARAAVLVAEEVGITGLPPVAMSTVPPSRITPSLTCTW